MTYVIAEPCIDVLDRAGMEKCPVEAIHHDDDVPTRRSASTAENAAVFSEQLPGRPAAPESPGAASTVGRSGVDTALVGSSAPRA